MIQRNSDIAHKILGFGRNLSPPFFITLTNIHTICLESIYNLMLASSLSCIVFVHFVAAFLCFCFLGKMLNPLSLLMCFDNSCKISYRFKPFTYLRSLADDIYLRLQFHSYFYFYFYLH